MRPIGIGCVYASKVLSGSRVVEMKLPQEFAKAWPGPQFGIAGSRKLTGVEGRPLIGTIIKPARGLRPHESAALVKEVTDAAVEFVKADEQLKAASYSPLA